MPEKLLKKFDYKNETVHKVAKQNISLEKEKQESSTKKTRSKKNKSSSVVFLTGEKTVLSIVYLGVEAGVIDIEVLPRKHKGKKSLYHVKGLLRSTPLFSWFYRVYNQAESFFDVEKLYSHTFRLQLHESRKERDLLELYDEESLELHYWDRMRHTRKGFRLVHFTKKLAQHSQDALSALFYLRTLKLEQGQSYSFPVVSNGKPWMIRATVEEKSTLQTSLGAFPAIKVSLESRFEGILKKRGDIFIWLSDDKNRFLLKVDATVKIGRVTAYLKSLRRRGI